MTVTASAEGAADAVITAVLYGENDVLLGSASAAGEARLELADNGARFAKVFLWNSLDGMEPAAKATVLEIE